MFLSTEDLKLKLMKEIEILKEVNLSEYYFNETDGRGNEGTYIFSDNKGSYHFIYSERGSISKHKITDSVFEISFWFIDSIASDVAMNFMNNDYKEGDNYRKKLFAKQLEILGEIDKNYEKAGEIEIDEILKLYP